MDWGIAVVLIATFVLVVIIQDDVSDLITLVKDTCK